MALQATKNNSQSYHLLVNLHLQVDLMTSMPYLIIVPTTWRYMECSSVSPLLYLWWDQVSWLNIYRTIQNVLIQFHFILKFASSYLAQIVIEAFFIGTDKYRILRYKVCDVAETFWSDVGRQYRRKKLVAICLGIYRGILLNCWTS